MDICTLVSVILGGIGFLMGAAAAGILSASAIAGHRSAVNTLEKTIDIALKTQSRTKALTKNSKQDQEGFTEEELTAYAKTRI